MTIQEFFNYWLNKPCNIDGRYGNQCKDLFSAFNKDVVIAPYFVGNPHALEFINGKPNPAYKSCLWKRWETDKVMQKYYDRIPNSLTFVPKAGDQAIFAASVKVPTGHISTCTGKGNVIWFESMDQNWPAQGYYDKNGDFIGTGVPHYVKHNYLSPKLLGVLRPKK